MRRAMLAIVAAAAAVLLACGSGTRATPTATPSPSPTATPVSDEQFSAAAEAAVKSALITLKDFPHGWSVVPPDNAPDDTKLGPGCELLDDPGARAVSSAGSDSFEFAGPGQTEVQSGALAFRTAEAARVMQVAIEEEIASCRDRMNNAIRRIATSGLTAPERTRVAIQATSEDLVVPTIGDSTWAFRIVFTATGPRGSVTGRVDQVYVRSGRLIGVLSVAQFDEDTPRSRNALAKTVADRLAAADAKLPQ